MRGICSIDGCGRTHFARGWCRFHYVRWWTRGTTDDPKERKPIGWREDAAGYIVRTVEGSGYPPQTEYQHIYIVETVLGRPLPEGAEIHHFDGNRSNNSNGNLVACPDKAYHKLLHSRQQARAACGNPDWRPCVICKNYDAIENMRIHTRGERGGRVQHRYCHRQCYSDYRKYGKVGTRSVA